MTMTETATQVATQQGRPPIFVLRERLEARKEELKNSLPSDISPEQFVRAVVTGAQLNPEILACTWQSVWNACVLACRDGLLPDGQEGAIVPYKGRAGWIPMYQGLLRRFRRSGQFKWVTAGLVREGERFTHFIDELGEHFHHTPGYDFGAPIVKIYAMATTREEGIFITVLPIAEANKIRNMSRTTRDDSPWKMWPEEMYKKTALRRLAKYLPSARDLIGEDSAAELVAPLAAAPGSNTPAAFGPASYNEMRAEAQRVTGAAAALETFASSTPESAASSAAADREGGGEQDALPAGSTSSVADASDSTSAATATPPSLESENVAIAHRRGQEAKAANHKRTAVPGEYRMPDRQKESEAWFAGYDGKPVPPTGALL
jgi:recombination protein RecT